MFPRRSAHGMRRATFCLGVMSTKSMPLSICPDTCVVMLCLLLATVMSRDYKLTCISLTANPATHDDHQRKADHLVGGETPVTKLHGHGHVQGHRRRRRTPMLPSLGDCFHSNRRRKRLTHCRNLRPHPTSTALNRQKRSLRNAYSTVIGVRTRSGR